MGLMRCRWSPGPGPTSPGPPDCGSKCWFSAGGGERGALQLQGAGPGRLARAQHITLGGCSLGRSLGQQTPSRSELSWQHEGTGPGPGGTHGTGGLSPLWEEDLYQRGGL